MFIGSVRLSVLAGVMAFGATGVTLALLGLGLPYVAAATVPAVAVGLLMHGALRMQPGPDRSEEVRLREALEAYRVHTATMRHDLRGVLSPALMMSDRLLNHAEPTVQRAGTAVVRSIERATAVLSESKAFMERPDAPRTVI